jgi:Rrf2 family protein
MSANSRFPVSVHILAYLAYRQGHVVPSAEIAASVDTNPVVIRRLLAALVKGRLVATTKGSAGGFSLTRAPAEISLLDIQRAVEPQPANGLARFMPNPDCPVGAKIGPVLHQAFDRARVGMEAELARVSLGDVQAQLAAVCPGKKT